MFNSKLFLFLLFFIVSVDAATLEDSIKELEVGTIISMQKPLLVEANQTSPLWIRGNGVDPKNTCEITTDSAPQIRSVANGSELTVTGFSKNTGKDHVEILVDHPIIQSIKMWSEGYSTMLIGDLNGSSCDHTFSVRP